MAGPPDRDRGFPKPYLIEANGEGGFRLTLRAGRYNSQNYPIVTTTVIEEKFATSTAARDFARREFSATTGEFAVPRRRAK